MKSLAIACFLIIISLAAFAQNIPSYVPTNGLVGWWPFNGNANDESGNGNNGTVNGATITSDRFGNSNTAYSFDGQNDYINIPYSNLLHGQSGTINAWIKTTGSFSSQKNIFSQSSGRPQLVAESQGINGNQYTNSAAIHWKASSGQFPNAQSISAVDNGQWTMITGIYTPNSFEIYVNGIRESATTTSLTQDNCSQFDFQIGGFNETATGCGAGVGFSQMFNGLIDDIGIYNRALTQQEITNLYNASVPPPPCNPLPSNLQTGLVGYWPFCGNANDESGNLYNGTLNGATLTQDRFGNSNRAFSFSNSAGGIRVQSFYPIAKRYSISYWVYYASGVGNTSIRDLSLDWGNDGEFVTYRDFPNNISFATSGSNGAANGSNITNQTSATNEIWYHVVCVRDSNQMMLYVNNALNATTINNSINSGVVKNLFIGGDPLQVAQNSNAVFNGKIDDICIWNRALDFTEITQLYQTQSSNSPGDYIGVNVIDPQRSLHVKDVIRLEPRTSAPDNPVKGDIYFDGVLNKLRVFDGTTWQNCW